ncbi:NAD(P)/FAD-dependent oxidoreductase [Rheinheimera fenheensis]|uniref:NAD(P)/FAD-dependent oxidoreductase n=1 Tax=Rheinheimera fenheensis TaxID=3152295 RepID=UPI00325D5425
MYDPLVDSNIGVAAPYPASYWATTEVVNRHATPYSKLSTDIDTDVVVIGGGYTGLSCAYQLANKFSREVTLLEANQIGWGCSGRNAGFVLRGTGRLGLAQLSEKFGLDIAQGFHQEYSAALALVEQMIDAGSIDCQRQQAGYLKVAHKPSLVDSLQQQADYLQRQFGYQTEFLSAQALNERYMQNSQAYGALRFEDCYGINPLALALGYARMATGAGAKLYSATPALSWQRSSSGGFVLRTPEAAVRCKQLVLATNGYTPNRFYPALNGACLPVLSSIIVTSPLTEQQVAQSGLWHNQLVMDTRALKYYYRKLPDNRILFGGRSAVYGKDAEKPVYPRRLEQALTNCFPMLEGISADYHWSGWVAVSIDDLPRVCQAEPDLFYAAGYCGSGLSFSTQAGKRLAQLCMGQALPALPLYQGPLKPFPLPSLRRLGQQAYYQWGRFSDRFL